VEHDVAHTGREANLLHQCRSALFWGQEWKRPDLIVPYQVSGHASDGDALVDAWRKAQAASLSDAELIDEWARILGIRIGTSGWLRKAADRRMAAANGVPV